MSVSHFLRAGLLAASVLAFPISAKAETLTEALASAYTNNPDIASALLSVMSSSEGIALAKSGLLPQIGASADLSGTVVVPGGGAPVSRTGNFQVGLTYRQTIYDNLQTEAEIEQARAGVELSTYALANAEQNVLFSVASAYAGVIRDSQLVTLRQANVEFFEAQVRSAEDRLRIGEGTRIDVSQAQARLAQAVAAARAAVANLQTSQASYERYVGHRPENLTREFDFRGLLPNSIDDAIASAEARHPAILSARAAIRIAQAGSDAARAAFGPTLDLIGQIGAATTFGGPSAGTASSGSLRLTLSIPIYAGGALGASVRRANLEQMRSEVDAMSARDQVREAVITSWATLQNARAQIESANAAVTSGNLVLQGIIQERDVGQRTTLDVLNAQAELTTARESLIGATSSQFIASFALIAASGRLSAQELALPVRIRTGEGYTAEVEDVWQELRTIEVEE